MAGNRPRVTRVTARLVDRESVNLSWEQEVNRARMRLERLGALVESVVPRGPQDARREIETEIKRILEELADGPSKTIGKGANDANADDPTG